MCLGMCIGAGMCMSMRMRRCRCLCMCMYLCCMCMCVYVYEYVHWSKEVLKSNFGQYGQLKSRVRRKKIQLREMSGNGGSLCFSNDSWVGKIGSLYSGGCGAKWLEEKWKIARCCGAKHIFKSKWKEHSMLGPLFEVRMWKNCTPRGAKRIWNSNLPTTPAPDRFWTSVPKEIKSLPLGGIVTREEKGHAEVEQRIAATMVTWNERTCFSKARCPIRWKLIIYDSMIRSKLMYGGGTFACFARKTGNMSDQRFTKNCFVWTPHFGIETRTPKSVVEPGKLVKVEATQPSLVWNIWQCITEECMKLTVHILRTEVIETSQL